MRHPGAKATRAQKAYIAAMSSEAVADKVTTRRAADLAIKKLISEGKAPKAKPKRSKKQKKGGKSKKK